MFLQRTCIGSAIDRCVQASKLLNLSYEDQAQSDIFKDPLLEEQPIPLFIKTASDRYPQVCARLGLIAGLKAGSMSALACFRQLKTVSEC
jgi:hypothetical protein